ncbi:MAG: SusC/RagA family TonB-linked outer membrane protein [Bacteroidetes bacterium]|nr:SusC/RagA family TonB-linked outer membrane protein [Bacteroidota bacterium]
MRKFTLVLALLLLVGLQGVFAQTRVISGTVTSSDDKQPIPGVTVVVPGTTIGTNTGSDGKYVLAVPTKYTSLTFSYVGMKTKQVALGTATTLDVVMDNDVMNMDEVVVTAIGIARETKALSYSVQEVGSDDIMKSARTDAVNSLQGKVSDVQVINSAGVAGGATYVQIRGVQSITQNNQPLYVIDGVPISGSESGGVYGVDGVATSNRNIDINPDDIESMNVLKGGAATALYGLRAASGAIVITTKKGKATPGKKISVNFNTYVQFDKVSMLPKMQTEYSQGHNGKWYSGDRLTWGAKIDTMSLSKDPSVWNTWKNFDTDGSLVSNNSAVSKTGPAQTYNPYDFFQTGVTTNNSLSLMGGTDVSTFYFSFSDNQSKGVVPNNKFRRNTFKLTGDTKLGQKVKLSGSANYMITGGDRIQQGSNTSGLMLGLLRTPSTFDNSAGYLLPDMENGTMQRSYRHGRGYDNPYFTANENKYSDQVNRLIGNVQIDYYTTKWLSITYRLGIDWWGRKWNDYMNIYSSSYYPDGYNREGQEMSKDMNSDFMINIDKDFAKDFNLKVLLGQNMTQQYYKGLSATANGLVIPEYYNLNNGTTVSAATTTSEVRRAALYGDIQLSWKNMLYLNITGRNDWTTTLAQGKNSFFYPSVGLGWIFTELPGLKDNKVLPYGKLRVSYAIVAKDASPYNTMTYYNTPAVLDGWTTGLVFPWSGNNAFAISNNLGNNQLKPEKTTTWEVGADLKFWQNRFGFSYTFFHNKGQDLILSVPIAASTGYSTTTLNAASMTTYGHEVTLDIVPIKSKSWYWDIIVNWSCIKNNVDALAAGINQLFLGGFEGSEIDAFVGQPYRTIYGYDWVRDAQGNLRIGDDGYPVMSNNMTALGNVDPKWTAGIGTNLRWKDLSLYLLFDIKYGGKMWNGTRGALDYFGTSAGTLNRDEWYVFPGVNSQGQTNTIPVKRDYFWMTQNVGSGFTGPMVDYVENSGWVRLRTLSLSYSFTSLLKKTFIKGLSVYFTGTNLWISTKYQGIDPETNLLGASNAQGIDYFNMPGTKSYTVGLNLSF